MKKYNIIFDDGNIRILVGMNFTAEEAKEIIAQQLNPSCYKIVQDDERVAG